MVNRRENRVLTVFAAALVSFLQCACEPTADEGGALIPADLTVGYGEGEYPSGHYSFLDANPLSEGFGEEVRLEAYSGKYMFWSIGCPL